jgi:sterol desaturase/sphingolipid hydroxylase (fatty acid hydroxylase superfamily)
MYFVYTKKIPFFEQYRVNKDKPWPWEENYEKWCQLLKRSLLTIAIDLWVVTPILFIGALSLDFYVDMDVNRIPSFFNEVFPQMVIMHILEDLFFFTSHWLLHQPFLYKYHKIHHEYTTTVTTAGLYSHLVEFLIANSIPAGIYMKVASLYAPFHVSTAVIWLVLRLWDAHNGHSGYVFSWTPLQLLPFCANDDYHDFHHSHNCGNYTSQFRYLDTIFGTNRKFKEYKKTLKAKQQ